MKDYLDYAEGKMDKAVFCDEEHCPENMYCGLPSLPECPQTTMAYIPFQTNTTMYEPEMALKCGTLYPDLCKPFLGGKCI